MILKRKIIFYYHKTPTKPSQKGIIMEIYKLLKLENENDR
jgi:hypothetical protein